eukprot:TRINITY_DN4651_c0_g5_i1.p1 TRINITY_DN4651_c0_g5~~TRINITY_DN4651_c0_g5_i1.p1  ORF type:complete len:500 (+),score=112.59 TRINITY_DN4651_c0_g5_i1:54-1502(+)
MEHIEALKSSDTKQVLSGMDALVRGLRGGREEYIEALMTDLKIVLELLEREGDVGPSAERVLQEVSRTKVGASIILGGAMNQVVEATVQNGSQKGRQALAMVFAEVCVPGHIVKLQEENKFYFLEHLVTLMCDDNPTTSLTAARTLGGLLGDHLSRSVLTTHTKIVDSLQEKFKTRSVEALRILEVLIQKAGTDTDLFTFLETIGALDAVVDGVETVGDDILMLLNYLEILETIAKGPLGARFCGTRKGLGTRIIRIAEQDLVDVASDFAIRFIGRFAEHSEENCVHALRSNWLESVVKSRNLEKKIEALGGICTQQPGLAHVVAQTGMFADFFIVPKNKPDLLEISLHAIAAILESSAISVETVCPVLLPHMAQLLDHRNHQIVAVRQAGLRFLAAALKHSVFVAYVSLDQLMWDYFLDVDCEMDYTCKEIKFGALQNLHRNKGSIEGRDSQEILEIELLTEKGPFYTKRETRAPQVEFDG